MHIKTVFQNRGDFMKFYIDFNIQTSKFIVTVEGVTYNGKYISKMDSFECYLKAKQQDRYNRATY